MDKSPLKELWEEIPNWFKMMFALMIIFLFLSLIFCAPEPRQPRENIDYPASTELMVLSHQKPKPIYVDVFLKKKVWIF